MSAGDFRIIVDIKDVTEGDVDTVAQDIWDRHAADLDAKLGDFGIRVMSIKSGGQFEIDWTPAGE